MPPISGPPSTDTPVMFPPGWAKLVTSPVPTGSPRATITMGIVVVACLAAKAVTVPGTTIRSTFSLTNSAAKSGSRSHCPFRAPNLNADVLAHNVAALAQTLHEGFILRVGFWRETATTEQESNPVNPPRPLRLGGERRGEEAEAGRG